MGKGEEGGQVEAVGFSILTGAMLFSGRLRLRNSLGLLDCKWTFIVRNEANTANTHATILLDTFMDLW
jgi:hypothetical protein